MSSTSADAVSLPEGSDKLDHILDAIVHTRELLEFKIDGVAMELSLLCDDAYEIIRQGEPDGAFYQRPTTGGEKYA